VESPHGIFCHPKSGGISSLKYDIGSLGYTSFDTTVGIADLRNQAAASPVTFEVYGDGRQLWKSQPVQAWGQAQNSGTVNVAGVKHLELRVACPDDAALAYAVWCEPRLFRVADPPPSPPRAKPSS
jgi:hypothetical protein